MSLCNLIISFMVKFISKYIFALTKWVACSVLVMIIFIRGSSILKEMSVHWSWVFIGRTEHSWTVLSIHWKDWCWNWNSKTLATWCEELTHLKRPWCWERLRAEGEGDDRGFDGWMASLIRWPWVWLNSGSWWWTGRTGMLRFMWSQRVGQDWAIELNWYPLPPFPEPNNS